MILIVIVILILIGLFLVIQFKTPPSGNSKKVAIALKSKVACKRIAVVVLGFEVPHAHIHLIPIDNESEIDFANPRVKLSKDEMLSIVNDVNKEFLLLS